MMKQIVFVQKSGKNTKKSDNEKINLNQEVYRAYRAYLKVSMAYAIMLVGKKDESVHCGTQKAPELQLRGFSIP